MLTNVKPLLDFLDQPVFFHGPYRGNQEKVKLIFDASLAVVYSTDDGEGGSENWQELLESVTPAWPDMPRSVEKKILEVLDQMSGKDYSGLDEVPLIYNMQGDVSRLLHCYAYGEVDLLWKSVEEAYLLGGIPCGWDGKYPEGRMVVYSNSPAVGSGK
ncbi:hypothetical protein NU688_07970 [Variovorax sp. ZS18.2.2]|uniref:hypothetical protein n=1 Tax=Variovorax sp. ZS18.2.2 TaxID=2971255 RepID=UPI002150BADD|nr:hypothetical protein [Variovorax sp. ZS18.2.2]MCR6476089.1 hypothetical protein [Variovorax sp. ZS18.2.2]